MPHGHDPYANDPVRKAALERASKRFAETHSDFPEDDLHYVESIDAYLTRVSWHTTRTIDAVLWAARNADGHVESGTASSYEDARQIARTHALGG